MIQCLGFGVNITLKTLISAQAFSLKGALLVVVRAFPCIMSGRQRLSVPHSRLRAPPLGRAGASSLRRQCFKVGVSCSQGAPSQGPSRQSWGQVSGVSWHRQEGSACQAAESCLPCNLALLMQHKANPSIQHLLGVAGHWLHGNKSGRHQATSQHPCWTARRFVEGNPDLALGPDFDRLIEQSHQDLAAAMGALDTSLRSISK